MLHVKTRMLKLVLRVMVWVYHVLMKTVTAPNGKEVAVFETPSGVKGYIDTSIPQEALDGLKAKLEKKLGLSPSPQSGKSPRSSRHSTD